MARKLDNPDYCHIAPVLPSYKPKVSDEIQDLFKYVRQKISDSSSNAIDEKDLPLKIPAHNQSSDLSQDRYHVDTTISEVSIVEKKIPESLTPLSSEFLIKNDSDIDTLILLLQQKFQMSQERLKQRLPLNCRIIKITGKKSARV